MGVDLVRIDLVALNLPPVVDVSLVGHYHAGEEAGHLVSIRNSCSFN